MDLLKLLRKEEGKLLAVSSKVETKLSQIRAAINALSTNGHKPYRAGVSKLRGRKLKRGASSRNQGRHQEGEGREGVGVISGTPRSRPNPGSSHAGRSGAHPVKLSRTI